MNDNEKRLTIKYKDLTGDSACFQLAVNLHGVTAEIGAFYTDDIRDLLESVGEALTRADDWSAQEDADHAKWNQDEEKRRQRAAKAEMETLKALEILDGYEKKWMAENKPQQSPGGEAS
jgi:hypothetical protein